MATKIEKMYNPSVSKDFEFDIDFPIQFCPVCGSEHTTGQGREEPLFKTESWLIRCNTCKWEIELFIIKRGKKKFQFRFDSVDCKQCKKELPYLNDKGLIGVKK